MSWHVFFKYTTFLIKPNPPLFFSFFLLRAFKKKTLSRTHTHHPAKSLAYLPTILPLLLLPPLFPHTITPTTTQTNSPIMIIIIIIPFPTLRLFLRLHNLQNPIHHRLSFQHFIHSYHHKIPNLPHHFHYFFTIFLLGRFFDLYILFGGGAVAKRGSSSIISSSSFCSVGDGGSGEGGKKGPADVGVPCWWWLGVVVVGGSEGSRGGEGMGAIEPC